ncbi:DUF423 domain-containing protein [Sneathiella limimaris]|uniref:DUF423 domain-containing protein n=1 Tax=Sneathiella limimaris TaxID=1964213 RepID=UPI00146A0AF9|nr:DUF423 domain-containing protein [Sneathiella limimaris]
MRFPWLVLAALFGALAVVLGAIGAHLVMGDQQATRFHDTALQYQMFSLLPLVVSDILIRRRHGNGFASLAAFFTTVGIILFSGSLYLRAWYDIQVGFNITPTGGICLILGWICLVFAALVDIRKREHN